MIETNKIYQGDTLEVLKTFPDECIDCILTSPPYYGLRSYLPKDHPNKKKEIGSESSMEEHIKVLIDIFTEVKRILKPAGSFWLNYGDCYGGSGMGMSYAGKTCGPNSILKGKLDKFPEIGHSRGKYDKCMLMLPERFAIAMVDELGWTLRQKLIWAKQVYFKKQGRTHGSAMPCSCKDRFNTTYEYLFHFVKSKKYYFDLDSVRIPHQTQENRPDGIIRAREYGYDSKYLDEYSPQGKQQGQRGEKTNAGELGKFRDNQRSYRGKFVDNPDIETYGSPRARELRRQGAKEEGMHTFYTHTKRFKAGEYQDRNAHLTMRSAPQPDEPNAFNINGKNLPNVWLISPEPQGEKHYATFPQGLITIPIIASCSQDGIVLDPFAGICTTGVVAKKLNRQFIGIELNEEYIKIGQRRIEATTVQEELGLD